MRTVLWAGVGPIGGQRADPGRANGGAHIDSAPSDPPVHQAAYVGAVVLVLIPIETDTPMAVLNPPRSGTAGVAERPRWVPEIGYVNWTGDQARAYAYEVDKLHKPHPPRRFTFTALPPFVRRTQNDCAHCGQAWPCPAQEWRRDNVAGADDSSIGTTGHRRSGRTPAKPGVHIARRRRSRSPHRLLVAAIALAASIGALGTVLSMTNG